MMMEGERFVEHKVLDLYETWGKQGPLLGSSEHQGRCSCQGLSLDVVCLTENWLTDFDQLVGYTSHSM